MRFFTVSLTLMLAIAVSAQEKKGPNPFEGPYKNLKTLKPEAVQPVMMGTRAGLGVMCTFCHVAGDWASDENPKKATAIMMINMVREINGKFPDGQAHVTCYTCHRGESQPKVAPPPAAPAKQ